MRKKKILARKSSKRNSPPPPPTHTQTSMFVTKHFFYFFYVKYFVITNLYYSKNNVKRFLICLLTAVIYLFIYFFSCMMNWSSCGSNVKRKADRLSKGWTLNIYWSRNFMNVNSSWHSYKTAINDMYIMFLHKAFFAFTRFIILLWRKKRSPYLTCIGICIF